MPLIDLKRMKNVFLLAILLLDSTSTFAQSQRIGAYRFHKAKGNHTATIIISNEPFDSSKHKVAFDKNVGSLIDDHKAYGAESVPRTQIKSIKFYFDGKQIKVPRWLYSDCYNPNLERQYVKMNFARDSPNVKVLMWGADGAGAYGVVWMLRKNGKHSRYFKDAF
jgi:hypothetical protein